MLFTNQNNYYRAMSVRYQYGINLSYFIVSTSYVGIFTTVLPYMIIFQLFSDKINN